MHRAKFISYIVLGGAFAVLLAGCVPPKPINTNDDPNTELRALRHENDKLKTRNETLEVENADYKAKYESLADREKLLAKKVRELQQDCQKQSEIIDVLNAAKTERDELSTEVQQTRKTIVQLQMRIQELEQKLNKAKN
jgi:chromosome segregation ATPase